MLFSVCGRVRRSVMTFLLFAPAMFCWGLGTTSIGQDAFGLSKSASVALPLLATISIPTLDSLLSHLLPLCFCQVWLLTKYGDLADVFEHPLARMVTQEKRKHPHCSAFRRVQSSRINSGFANELQTVSKQQRLQLPVELNFPTVLLWTQSSSMSYHGSLVLHVQVCRNRTVALQTLRAVNVKLAGS